MKFKFTALLLAGALGVSLLTGCGGIDKNAAVATRNGQKVPLGVMNFFAQFQRASIEDMYHMYVGEDVWDQDFSGSGTTVEDDMKESVLDSLHSMYTLKDHMSDYNIELTEEEKSAITEAAAKFMSDNSQAAIDEMGASQEVLEELLTLLTIQQKMQAAIKDGADVTVSDAEANMRGYTQLEIRTDSHTDDSGNSVEYTQEEKDTLTAMAYRMLLELDDEGATLESVAQAHGYTTTEESYSTYSAVDETDGSNVAEVVEALRQLLAGQTSDLIVTDNACYIVRVDSDTNFEKTEERRQSLLAERLDEYYNDLIEEWQTDDGWEVNENNYGKVHFENTLTTTAPEGSAESTP